MRLCFGECAAFGDTGWCFGEEAFGDETDPALGEASAVSEIGAFCPF